MVKERIEKLRALMREKKVDAYLVPTDDYHCSEYVGDFFKCRTYITGFTGSAGTALIMEDMAGLWTDGRYFIQAERQIKGNGVTLFKMGQPGVPTIEAFLNDHLKEGQCLGFDGKTMSAFKADSLIRKMQEKGVSISCEEDLIGEIWDDRPALSCEPVFELDLRWSGKSRQDKLMEIRKDMKEKQADLFLLTSLEDIAWLLNIRGGDIHTCPVVLSYLLMTQDEIRLYANEKAFSQEIRQALADDGVTLYPYTQIYEDVKSISSDKHVILDKENVNHLLLKNLPKMVWLSQNLFTG